MQGAFTGANRDKSGLFEEADGGTHLPRRDREDSRVGAGQAAARARPRRDPPGRRDAQAQGRTRASICATGSDLRERIREGRFLEDLYYRLNDITVRVPALRERREDIPVLAQHFLAMYSRQMEKTVRGFAPEVLRVFLEHEWRGNVRELEKTVKRMVVLADDGDALGARAAAGRDARAPDRTAARSAAAAARNATGRAAPHAPEQRVGARDAR